MTADSHKSVLVYDVGGSHVSAAVCRCAHHAYRLGPVVSASHPPEQTIEAFIQLLYSLGVEASKGVGRVEGAELAMPGPFDFNQGMSLMRHKLPYIYGVDLRRPMACYFGWDPTRVRFLHDASAFLLGETSAGAARGVPRAAGITLGTGIGSAFAIDGHIVTEGCGVPPGGEIWNLPYQGGMIEDSVSSRAIRRSYQLRTGLLREVAELAAGTDDRAAIAAFNEFGRHLGLALRMAVVSFSPNVVVLGGGISRSAHLFLSAAQHELRDLDLQLRVSALLDDAPLVGAAVAWFNSANGSFAHSDSHANQADAY